MKAGSSEEVNLWLVETKSQRLKLERDVFLSGYVKAFLLSVSTCSLCKDCATNRESCRYKESVRPSPEGFAVDLFSTVPKVGFPIQVLKGHNEEMNR